MRSTARFDVIEGGRRAGKSELAKRHGVVETLAMSRIHGRWICKFAAPTIAQAKAIFWQDLCDLSKAWWAKQPNLTDHILFLRGGGEIWVVGLDKPQRIEGSPLNRLYCDELADVKDGAWERNLKPALDTEIPGMPAARAWLLGVPRPGGQFAKLARMAQDPTEPSYAYHTWTSERVLSREKIAEAKRTLDPRIYAQEYLAQRIALEGRAYYQFGPGNMRDVEYDPRLPLLFAFDFNRSPGVAVVAQEQDLDGVPMGYCPNCQAEKPGLSGAQCPKCLSLLPRQTCSVAVGEVHIPDGSNTTMVATRLCTDWRHHTGPVICYGDPAGGAKTASSVDGSDWDLLRRYLARDFPQAVFDVDKAHPPVRARLNAVNARCLNEAGEIRLFVHPEKAKNLANDLNAQMVVKGGSGELDKDTDKTVGHAADAWGYLIQKLYPVDAGESESVEAM